MITMELNQKSEIDHITILVADLEQSIHWYTTSFGCELIHRSKTLAVISFRNIKLVLSLPSEQRPHVAIRKDNASEFGEIMEQSDLCKSTFISDPTGNLIELIESSIEEL